MLTLTQQEHKMTIYTKEQALKDHRAELAYARKLKAECHAEVTAMVAGRIAAGREQVPIDEYIKMWEDGIVALRTLPPGADAEAFNY
jgi:hypothetical protein